MALTAENVSKGSYKEYFVPILGFYLGASFFQPLIFKALGNEFFNDDPAQYYKCFTLLYLLLPIVVLIGYWYYEDFKTIAIARWGNVRIMIRHLLFLFLVISCVSCYLLFFSIQEELPWRVFVFIPPGLLLVYILWLTLSSPWNKDGYKQSWIVFALSLTLTPTLFLTDFNVDPPLKPFGEKEIPLDTVYSRSFDSLKMLRNREKLEKEVQKDLKELESNIQKKLFVANLNVRDSKVSKVTSLRKEPKGLDSFFPIDDPKRERTICTLKKGIDSIQVDDTTQTSILRLGALRTAVSQLKRISNSELNAKKVETLKVFEYLFSAIRKRSIYALASIIVFGLFLFGIIVLHGKGEESEGKILKIFIGFYLLLFFNMLKPIDVKHINIEEPGFEFMYSNWYLPHFIQNTIAQSGFVDQSNNVYNITDEFDPENIFQRIEQTEKTLVAQLRRIDSMADTISKRQLDKTILDKQMKSSRNQLMKAIDTLPINSNYKDDSIQLGKRLQKLKDSLDTMINRQIRLDTNTTNFIDELKNTGLIDE